MLSSTRFRVACVVTCLILAAVFASSCFVPSANRFRAVATLLEDGKVGEASAKAREVASALTSPAETWQPYNIPVKAVILWKDGVAANPGLSKDEAAQEAGCYLAKAIPDYALAAEINPDDIDAQYNAALSLASTGRTEEALSHAREARRIVGGRADVLRLLEISRKHRLKGSSRHRSQGRFPSAWEHRMREKPT